MPFCNPSSPPRKTFCGMCQIWSGKCVDLLLCATSGMLGWVLASQFPSKFIDQRMHSLLLSSVHFSDCFRSLAYVYIYAPQWCEYAIFQVCRLITLTIYSRTAKIAATDWALLFLMIDWVWWLTFNHVCTDGIRKPAFNWLKGALCSIDRRWEKNGENVTAFQNLTSLFLGPKTLSWGVICNHHVHHINDCHTAHHLFPAAPGYNLMVLLQFFFCRPFCDNSG